MGAYPGESNAYGDATGGDVYASTLTDGFAAYVNEYSDIKEGYDSWVKDDANVHWADYVRLNPDLEEAWKQTWQWSAKEQTYVPGISRWDWGARHYRENGKNETRILPKVIDDPGTGRANMVTVIVKSDDRYSDSAKAAYGQYHFNRPEVQKETRIVPGYGPTFSLSADGKSLSVDPGISTDNGKVVFESVANKAKTASPGTYKKLIENISSTLGGKDNPLFKQFENAKGLDIVNSYYQKNKVAGTWDPKTQGAQPPVGGFDASYYKLNEEGGKKALQQWQAAQSSVSFGSQSLPDLDIVGKYTQDSYLHWYYTTQGKAAGERGNASKTAELTKGYKEELTDAEKADLRDKILGIDSTDDQDTFVEGKLSSVIGAKEIQQQQMFGALTQDSLKQAALKLQNAKKNEQELSFYSGMSGVGEILDLNKTIANSLLGDTGIGGILGWMGDPTKTQENLEKSLTGATGVGMGNSATYNWEKWFTDELVKRYEGGLTLTDPLDNTKEYEIDAAFAKDYIDRYLKPRFDTSRSMSEFISYMDVKQGEENVFQTQSALDSLRDIAKLRSKAYLDAVEANAPLNFDPAFYWDPTGEFGEYDKGAKLSGGGRAAGDAAANYAEQKKQVAEDWEIAKTQGNTAKVPGTDWTWNQWAYYYGLDPKNKDEFAKLHYQVRGAAQGFDGAKDLITMKKVEDFIDTKIIPEITNAKLDLGDISFLNFVTPAEYADKLLEGISPENQKEEWDKLLATLGLSEKDMGIEEVKNYIIEAFQTGAAKQIRESIKYLNEKKLTPTQERLGVDYIERPEDAKAVDDPSATELYKVFKNAGYQGSEDEFYNTFMTDVDKSEMQLVTQASKGLKTSDLFKGLSSSDPFESLFSIQSLLGDTDETTETKDTKTDTSKSSYFKLIEDDSDTSYKSKTGQAILGEFTSLFKGFS